MDCRNRMARLCRLLMQLCLAVCVGVGRSETRGHENHAPLPTKGVKIAGDTIMLSDKAREAIGLTTTKIGFGDIQRVVTVNARVEAAWDKQVMITSLVAGKISRILVRPGEAVTAGQELAQVVSSELESLQRALLQARGEVALASKLVGQRSLLDQQGVIAGKTLLESQTALASKTAALEMSRQKLLAVGCDAATIQHVEDSGEPLEYVSIVSPQAGVVVHADVRVGQLVSPTDHLYHVVDPSRLWIVGDVLESDVRFLEQGQPVVATFAAAPGIPFAGVVDHVRPWMDPRKRTQEVVVMVSNPERTLRPGMFGRLEISVRVVEQAVLCPTDAVLHSRTGTYLLVERMPGKYENRRVQLGLTQNGNTEVAEGVFPGDRVVVTGNALLAALLGNEHKARVATEYEDPTPQSDANVVAVLHGTIEIPTDQQVLATPQVEGRVHRILVRPGQQVSAGDVLAEIDSLQLRTVQLDFLQTLSLARLKQQSLARLEQLGGSNVLPRRQLWELENEWQTLQLQADGFQQQLVFWGFTTDAIQRLKQIDVTQHASVTQLLQTVPVRAPKDGCIVSFNVVPGQVVQRDEAMFEIHDLSRVWVKGHAFERDATHVSQGQSAHVRFAAYPELQAVGKVVRIAPALDERERVLPVWVEVANPDHQLKAGMWARVTLMAKSDGDSTASGGAQLVPLGNAR